MSSFLTASAHAGAQPPDRRRRPRPRRPCLSALLASVSIALSLAPRSRGSASALDVAGTLGRLFEGLVGSARGDGGADWRDALAHPRRDVRSELGEDGYRRAIAEALGEEGGTSDGVGDDDEEVRPGGEDGGRRRYGVDVSFPMHHGSVLGGNPLGDRQKFYDGYVTRCADRYGRSACERGESDRISMNLWQPRLMQNYTTLGFRKVRAPEKVYRLLRAFWRANRNSRLTEAWSEGGTYLNHWDMPTQMVNVDSPRLSGGGKELEWKIWDATREAIQEWIGKPLSTSSVYGIRIYRRGAVLAPHVDRLPLVSSAIINVDQDVNAPWPLEVIAHDGVAYNVTMEPGDMVLYESHSVVHGRPYPLQGSFYANVFVHFEPEGHTDRHAARMKGEL